jgi:hypothetical protein
MRRLGMSCSALALAAAAAIVLLAGVPGGSSNGIVRDLIEGPDASCSAATFVAGGTLDQSCGDGGKVISTGGGTGGGGFLGDLGPLAVVAAAGGGLLLLAAVVVFLRTRRVEVAAPSDDWWTCPRCGAGNVIGAARCHRCGTWRGAERESSASATR